MIFDSVALKTIIVIFRETLEISLILSIIMAAIKNIKNKFFYLGWGVFIGILLSYLIAVSMSLISNSFDGYGQEIFNIFILSLTVLVTSFTVLWMKNHSKNLKENITSFESKNHNDIVSQLSLITIIALTIFREGSEIVLLLQSIFISSKYSISVLIFEILISAAFGFAVGILIYFGLFKIAGRYIFKVTSFMLILISCGFAAEIASLIESINVNYESDPVWDSSWIIDDNSMIGQIFKIIAGYTSRPSVLQLVFYITTLLVLLFAFQKNSKKST